MTDTTRYAASPAGATVSPWRNRRVHTLNFGAFTANTGISAADVVYPLLLLGFTGKPILAGAFGAIQFAVMLLSTVPAGNLIDRHDRRKVLIASELARALTATVLAVTLAAGHVSLLEIYLIAVVLGACQPFGSVRMLALRSVVAEGQMTRALSTQQVYVGIATLIGPALGAAMFSASRSLPFTVIAAGFGISALCVFLVRFEGRPATPAADADAPAAAGNAPITADQAASEAAQPRRESPFVGLKIIWSSPLMRAALLFIMLINLIGVPLDLVIILEARRQGVPTNSVGLILATFAAGSIIGAPLVPRLHRLLPPGAVLVAFGIVATLVLAGLTLPLGGFWMALCMLAVGLILPAVETLVNVLIMQQVPDHQRGRVLSGVMTIIGLGMPLGAAAGGGILQAFSPADVLLGAAGVIALATVFAYSQRALRTAQWPSTTADAVAADAVAGA